MENYNMILTQMQQISFISDKIDKYEYLTGEEILPSNKRQIKEQVNITNSPLGKVLVKQTEK